MSCFFRWTQQDQGDSVTPCGSVTQNLILKSQSQQSLHAFLTPLKYTPTVSIPCSEICFMGKAAKKAQLVNENLKLITMAVQRKLADLCHHNRGEAV